MRDAAAAEICVLSRSFGDSAPTCVSCNVDHGIKGPVKSVGGRFLCGDFGILLPQLIIKAAAFGQRNGAYHPMSVYNVESEDQRNFKTALLHGNVLKMVDVLSVVKAEKGTDFAFSDPLLLLLKALGGIFGPLDVLFCYAAGLEQLLLFLLVDGKPTERRWGKAGLTGLLFPQGSFWRQGLL